MTEDDREIMTNLARVLELEYTTITVEGGFAVIRIGTHRIATESLT
jgi:hypothetical protein